MVMTTHYHTFSGTHQNTGGTQLELWWRSLFKTGGVAVDCFFVIAGFLAELPGRPPPVGGMGRLKAVLSKLLRLAPTYYAGVLFFLLTVLCISASKSAKEYCTDTVFSYTVPWVSVPLQLTMTQSFANYPLKSYEYFGVHDCSAFRTNASEVAGSLATEGNGALWFVSSLFWGGYVAYALIGGHS